MAMDVQHQTPPVGHTQYLCVRDRLVRRAGLDWCEKSRPLGCEGDRDGTVVNVLFYKSEGRWFDSRWYHWNFSLT